MYVSDADQRRAGGDAPTPATVVRAALADVCWETEFTPCDESNFRFDPQPPAGISYTPTCFDNRVESAVSVSDPTVKHATRCISASTQVGYAYCTELLTFEEAEAFCTNFRGDPNKPETMNMDVYDFRLPQSPLEAGHLCGSGCGYDFIEIWVAFGAPRHIVQISFFGDTKPPLAVA